MTDQQVMEAIDDMKRLFGKIPNPFHEPVRFAYYVKLYRYYKNG